MSEATELVEETTDTAQPLPEADADGQAANDEVGVSADVKEQSVLLTPPEETPQKKRLTEKQRKMIRNCVISPLMICVAAFFRAFVVHVFMLGFNFAPGGVSGIGTMLEYKTGFSTGYTTLICNVPLVIIAFIFLSRPYAIKTTFTVLISSLLMVIMKEFSFPQYGVNDPAAEPIFAALACGAFSGVNMAIIIRAGSSNGGTDVIGTLIQRKYQAAGITWFIMALDGIVIFASYFVYDNGLTPVFMSLTQAFITALVGDVILTGFKSALKFEIITNEPEQLSAELITKLKHSVTKMEATGMYSHSRQYLLICVIHKRQLSEFNKILKKYPGTFAYVTSMSEVYGKGFGG